MGSTGTGVAICGRKGMLSGRGSCWRPPAGPPPPPAAAGVATEEEEEKEAGGDSGVGAPAFVIAVAGKAPPVAVPGGNAEVPTVGVTVLDGCGSW